MFCLFLYASLVVSAEAYATEAACFSQLRSCHHYAFDEGLLPACFTHIEETTMAYKSAPSLPFFLCLHVNDNPAASSRAPLNDLGRECEYFTVLRHPIDRLVSAFYYCPVDHDVQSRPPRVSKSTNSTEYVAKACDGGDHEIMQAMLLVRERPLSEHASRHLAQAKRWTQSRYMLHVACRLGFEAVFADTSFGSHLCVCFDDARNTDQLHSSTLYALCHRSLSRCA